MILALDTSGFELIVALVDGGRLLEGATQPGPRHQERIFDLIAQVAGARLASVDAVAVVNGPGSHTGLRVGLSATSGMAFARRLPIYPVSSLLVAAHRRVDGEARLLALVGAGRGRAFVQQFESRGPMRTPVGARRLETIAGIDLAGATVIAEPALLAHLPGVPREGRRPGTEALAAAVNQVVGEGEALNYHQLTGDYGDSS